MAISTKRRSVREKEAQPRSEKNKEAAREFAQRPDQRLSKAQRHSRNETRRS